MQSGVHASHQKSCIGVWVVFTMEGMEGMDRDTSAGSGWQRPCVQQQYRGAQATLDYHACRLAVRYIDSGSADTYFDKTK